MTKKIKPVVSYKPDSIDAITGAELILEWHPEAELVPDESLQAYTHLLVTRTDQGDRAFAPTPNASITIQVWQALNPCERYLLPAGKRPPLCTCDGCAASKAPPWSGPGGDRDVR